MHTPQSLRNASMLYNYVLAVDFFIVLSSVKFFSLILIFSYQFMTGCGVPGVSAVLGKTSGNILTDNFQRLCFMQVEPLNQVIKFNFLLAEETAFLNMYYYCLIISSTNLIALQAVYLEVASIFGAFCHTYKDFFTLFLIFII